MFWLWSKTTFAFYVFYMHNAVFHPKGRRSALQSTEMWLKVEKKIEWHSCAIQSTVQTFQLINILLTLSCDSTCTEKKKSHTNHVKMDPVYWWKWRRVNHTVVEPSVLERDVPNDDVPILVHVSVCADSGVVCYLKVPTGQYRPPGVHPRHLP